MQPQQLLYAPRELLVLSLLLRHDLPPSEDLALAVLDRRTQTLERFALKRKRLEDDLACLLTLVRLAPLWWAKLLGAQTMWSWRRRLIWIELAAVAAGLRHTRDLLARVSREERRALAVKVPR